eukprot:2625288-Alexandrium_andersonii.AAC.1
MRSRAGSRVRMSLLRNWRRCPTGSSTSSSAPWSSSSSSRPCAASAQDGGGAAPMASTDCGTRASRTRTSGW